VTVRRVLRTILIFGLLGVLTSYAVAWGIAMWGPNPRSGARTLAVHGPGYSGWTASARRAPGMHIVTSSWSVPYARFKTSWESCQRPDRVVCVAVGAGPGVDPAPDHGPRQTREATRCPWMDLGRQPPLPPSCPVAVLLRSATGSSAHMLFPLPKEMAPGTPWP